jgi:hypothetical protein
MIKIKFKLPTTNHKPRTKLGSALILTVVLTSLLAIIGAMFIMITRVDRMATSSISENKELNFAIESVVAKISQELVLDVPGVAGAEHYDYPGDADKWLASLEPYKDGTNYYWQQISDVYYKFDSNSGLNPEIITDYQEPSEVVDSNSAKGYPADADGDGVADSKWVKLDDVTSNKGKPIYAAIRIIDNGGMLNVNTAYKFDPNSNKKKEIDGSNQAQINLFALAQRSALNTINQLEDMRKGGETWDLDKYINEVVWRIEQPSGLWTPFDISDELELLNRFLVNQPDIDTRIEEVWNDAFIGTHDVDTPVHTGGAINKDGWFDRANYDSDPNANDYYSYRHIATIYNMDRIIDPNGRKMLNINDANVSALYNTIIDANLNIANPNAVAAQMAVNLVDFRDNDSNVSVIDFNSGKYYGFERPCVYISELVHKFIEPNLPPSLPHPVPYIYRSYAIELHKPYTDDNYPEPNQWRLSIEGCPNSPFTVNWSGTQHFHVMLFEQPNAPLSVAFDFNDKDPKFSPQAEKTLTLQPGTTVFAPGRTISLERRVGTDWIPVDSVTVEYGPGPPYRVWDPDGQVHSYQRDITLHKCIRHLWDDSFSKEASATLGDRNVYENGDSIYIQAHPEDINFTNVGEIGMVFCKSAYSHGPYPIEPNNAEKDVRLNLADPCYQKLFQYLTVIDPNDHITDPNELRGNETKIKGRININTAPWYVLAQLPWVSQRISYNDTALAQAIVAYRDAQQISGGPDYTGRIERGFTNIGQLNNVNNGPVDYRIGFYATDGTYLTGFPDLMTPSDGAKDDFEERDVIFARISNLVTVRSDIFTAYILVRIGTDGPQKRVMAILDRSNVHSGDDKVRIIALHPVPDPR